MRHPLWQGHHPAKGYRSGLLVLFVWSCEGESLVGILLALCICAGGYLLGCLLGGLVSWAWGPVFRRLKKEFPDCIAWFRNTIYAM